MKTLYIDIETYSGANLAEVGVHKYTEDPEFEILLFGYAYDDDPVKVIDLKSGDTVPPEVLQDARSPRVLKTAYNAAFERTCINKHFGKACPAEQWECDMVLGAVCGLPMGLGFVGKVLDLGEDFEKDRAGKELIKYFCCPCRPTKTNEQRTRNLPEHDPARWTLFIDYNRQDVVSERALRKRLAAWKPDETEQRFWALDQRINDLGIKFDRRLAENAARMGDAYKAEIAEQAAQLTGLANPGSVAQVKHWLKEQEGVDVPSLNKKVVADVVAGLKTEKAKQFMQLRADISKSASKKFENMTRSGCEDDHIKGCFQFYGATRTGRFAGRRVQLQNMAQNHLPDLDTARSIVLDDDLELLRTLYPSVPGALGELVRTALIPEPGHKFLVADFSAIEARVIAWIAGEKWVLEEFEGDGLIYEATAAQMYKAEKEDIKKGGSKSHLRQKGKVTVLACGYGGGVNALKAFGADKDMTEEEMANAVSLWREANPRIVALWKHLENAALRCVQRKMPLISKIGNIRFDYENKTLWMTLPSGRRLAYYDPAIGRNRWGGPTLTYMGQDQTSKKWGRLETFGGRLTENLVQATARDCLRDAMLAADEAGFDIRAHIHDEIVVTEPINGRGINELCELMGQPLPWAPGLPLRADGDEMPYYQKM